MWKRLKILNEVCPCVSAVVTDGMSLLSAIALDNHLSTVSINILIKQETSDQPDRETCALQCHYL